jgi:hypothetical protein
MAQRGNFVDVKEEFIREVSQWTPRDEEEEEVKHHTGFQKRGKMMKKHQERPSQASQLCNSIKRGGVCTFGDTCKVHCLFLALKRLSKSKSQANI